MKVTWKYYESIMKVLWKYYESIMKDYESDILKNIYLFKQ